MHLRHLKLLSGKNRNFDNANSAFYHIRKRNEISSLSFENSSLFMHNIDGMQTVKTIGLRSYSILYAGVAKSLLLSHRENIFTFLSSLLHLYEIKDSYFKNRSHKMNHDMLHSIRVEFFQDDHKFNAPDVKFISIQRNCQASMVGLWIVAYTFTKGEYPYLELESDLYLYGDLRLYGENDEYSFKMILHEGQEWFLTTNMIANIGDGLESEIEWEERPVLIYERNVLKINQSFFAALMKKITEYLDKSKTGNIIFERKDLSEFSTHFPVSQETFFEDDHNYYSDSPGLYDICIFDNLPSIPPDLNVVSKDITEASA